MIGIFRHSKALSTDNEMARTLSDDGISQAREMRERILVKWDILLCSEAVRTQQTGMILADLQPQIIEELYIDFSPPDEYIHSLLQKISVFWANEENVLIVSHQPMVCPLLTAIIGKNLAVDVRSGEGVIINPDAQEYQWYKR